MFPPSWSFVEFQTQLTSWLSNNLITGLVILYIALRFGSVVVNTVQDIADSLGDKRDLKADQKRNPDKYDSNGNWKY